MSRVNADDVRQELSAALDGIPKGTVMMPAWVGPLIVAAGRAAELLAPPKGDTTAWRKLTPAPVKSWEWRKFLDSLTDDQIAFLQQKARREGESLMAVARSWGVPPTPEAWR